LQLLRQGRLVSLRDWGNELVEALRPIADRLDAVHGGADYRAAVEGAVLGLAKPEQLPSARVLQSMAADHENSFVAFARAHSLQTRASLLDVPLAAADQAEFVRMAAQSVADQASIEASDSMPFEMYRQEYTSASRLGRAVGEQALVAAE
jgi:glutamate--cysteine ligase